MQTMSSLFKASLDVYLPLYIHVAVQALTLSLDTILNVVYCVTTVPSIIELTFDLARDSVSKDRRKLSASVLLN